MQGETRKKKTKRSDHSRRRRRRRKRIIRGFLRAGLLLFIAVFLGLTVFLGSRLFGTLGKKELPAVSFFIKDEKAEIVLDAGHGGKDQGCSYQEILEKDLTLKVAKKTKEILEKEYQVALVREDDTFVSLAERAEFANEKSAEVFVSIHCNSSEDGTGEGIETFYAEEKEEMSSELAQLLQDSLINETGARDREVKTADYAVILNTQMPAALVEIGFLNSAQERELLQSEDYQEEIAKGIAEGIIRYLQLQEAGE